MFTAKDSLLLLLPISAMELKKVEKRKQENESEAQQKAGQKYFLNEQMVRYAQSQIKKNENFILNNSTGYIEKNMTC